MVPAVANALGDSVAAIGVASPATGAVTALDVAIGCGVAVAD
jgi:hypothetical protein